MLFDCSRFCVYIYMTLLTRPLADSVYWTVFTYIRSLYGRILDDLCSLKGSLCSLATIAFMLKLSVNVSNTKGTPILTMKPYH